MAASLTQPCSAATASKSSSAPRRPAACEESSISTYQACGVPSGSRQPGPWRSANSTDVRDMLSDVQRFEGGSIKHDVSVPVAAVPDFIAQASAAVEALIPGCRPAAFGHLGDGNVHFNVSQPIGADTAAYLARWDEMGAVVNRIVTRLHGSISAEHGIGQLKRDLLPEVKDTVALELMRALKRTLDPNGILNPGKVL